MRHAPLVLLFLMASAAPSTAAEKKRCGELGRYGEAGASIVSVRATGAPCGEVRRMLERFIAGRRTAGWTCAAAGTEARCEHRGGATAGYTGARRVRRCGHVAFQRNTDDGAFDIQGKRTRCRTARRVARGSRAFGPTRPGSYRLLGFRCEGEAIDSPLPVGFYTCRRRGATIVFARG